MKSLALMTAALALGFTLVTSDAEAARRFGGGKSSGMQRQELSQPKSPNATPATPAQAPGAAAVPGRAPAAAAAAAAPAKRSWMGPLAGLAAGIGLAALASHFGFGEELASMMMMGLLAMAAVALIGFFLRKRASAQQPALASASGMHYEADAPVPAAAPAQSASGGSAQETAPVGHIPADFDKAGFERNAKLNFIRLQAANDTRNLDDVRQYTTPEMFAEIQMAWLEEKPANERTEVINLDAQVLDVSEEAARYIVSVRFSGLLREQAAGNPEAIDETWHLVKPTSGQGGWLVAGIQQNA